MMELSDITKRIRALMDGKKAQLGKDWSFAALARQMDVSRETPRHWYDGRSYPKLDNLQPLATALDTTPIYIMFGLEDRIPPGTLREIVTPTEHDLIHAFRLLNSDGKLQLISYVRFLEQQFKLPDNVSQLNLQK